jgi:gluconate kinase
MPALRGHEIHKVFLAPTVEVALTRNKTRTNKNFDTARLVPIIHRLVKPAREGLDTWIVIDSSSLGVAETVDAILRSAV